MGKVTISRVLNVPQSTVSSIIRKWKEYGTTQTLPRAGRPNKLRNRARTLMREVTKNPMITLTELQSSLAEVGEPAETTTIPAALYKSRVDGRVARRKPLLTKRHMKDSESMRENNLWPDETKIEFWPECKALCLVETEQSSSPI